MKNTYIEWTVTNDGFDFHYQVDKEIHSGMVSYIIYKKKEDRLTEEQRIEFADIGIEYDSPLLRWENVIFCSASYISVTDHKYLSEAVQAGTKTAATVYVSPNSEEGKNLISKLPATCGAVEYGDSMIYVYQRGTLSDFFNFEKIKEIYIAHGCKNTNWDTVKRYSLFLWRTLAMKIDVDFAFSQEGIKSKE